MSDLLPSLLSPLLPPESHLAHYLTALKGGSVCNGGFLKHTKHTKG